MHIDIIENHHFLEKYLALAITRSHHRYAICSEAAPVMTFEIGKKLNLLVIFQYTLFTVMKFGLH